MKYPNYLIIVSGPTAVGKTSLTVMLAQQLNTEIISADARQFYKEMNIGTAKPSSDELHQVPHHLVDFISIKQNYDVKKFETDAMKVLYNKGKELEKMIVTGGSGLYIKTLTHGISYMPEISPSIRNKVNIIFEQEGLAGLQETLQSNDPDYFEKIDRNNPRRLQRALEIMYSTGKPPSKFLAEQEHSGKEKPFQIIHFCLYRERSELHHRINERVDKMFENGLLEEVRHLYQFRHLNALQTVGYKELFDYLDGVLSFDEAVEYIKRNTRRFAKRQMTWFRKMNPDHWINLSEQSEQQALHYIHSKISQFQ